MCNVDSDKQKNHMISTFCHNTSLYRVVYIYRIMPATYRHTLTHTHTHTHTYIYIYIYIYLFIYLFITGLEILSKLCIFKNLLKFINCIVREGLE